MARPLRIEYSGAICLLRTRTDMSLKQIGQHFGVSYAAVTQIKKSFDRKLCKDEALNTLIEQIDACLES